MTLALLLCGFGALALAAHAPVHSATIPPGPAPSEPFDLMTYPGSKHGLIRMADTGRHYYEMVLRFFRQAL